MVISAQKPAVNNSHVLAFNDNNVNSPVFKSTFDTLNPVELAKCSAIIQMENMNGLIMPVLPNSAIQPSNNLKF